MDDVMSYSLLTDKVSYCLKLHKCYKLVLLMLIFVAYHLC